MTYVYTLYHNTQQQRQKTIIKIQKYWPFCSKFRIVWWRFLFTNTFRCFILWKKTYFYKKVDYGDLGSFTVLYGIAENKRNFLAGEISGSFEKVFKFGLTSDIAKLRALTLLSRISLVSSIFKEFSHNSCFFLFFGN